MKLRQIGNTDVYYDSEEKNTANTVSKAICIGPKGVSTVGESAYNIEFLEDALKRLKKGGASNVVMSRLNGDLLLLVEYSNPKNAIIVAPRVTCNDNDDMKSIAVKVDKKKIANLRRSIKCNAPSDIEIEIAKIGIRSKKE